MDLPSLLGLPPRIAIEALCRTSTVLTVSLVSTAVAACCPPLSFPAVPSVAPAPNAATVGINEREQMYPVQGARWCSVCGYDGSFVPTRPAFCVSFAERFAAFVEPYARRTTRLLHALRAIGFTVGGEARPRV